MFSGDDQVSFCLSGGCTELISHPVWSRPEVSWMILSGGGVWIQCLGVCTLGESARGGLTCISPDGDHYPYYDIDQCRTDSSIYILHPINVIVKVRLWSHLLENEISNSEDQPPSLSFNKNWHRRTFNYCNAFAHRDDVIISDNALLMNRTNVWDCFNDW